MLKRVVAGFSLIELLIAIVILGILAGVALPSFNEFLVRTKFRSSAESVLNALQLARGEAVRRNELVTFTLGQGSGSGQTSWKVTDAANNTIQESRISGEGGAAISAAVTPAVATTVVFNGFGRTGATSLKRIKFSSTQTTLVLQVEVQPGGQIRMCDPNVTAAGSPKRCLNPS